MCSLVTIQWEGLTSLEGDTDLSSDPVVTLGESRVSNKTEPIRGFILELLVDPLSDTGIMPTPRTVDAAGNYLSCLGCEDQLYKASPIEYEPFELKTITELTK